MGRGTKVAGFGVWFLCQGSVSGFRGRLKSASLEARRAGPSHPAAEAELRCAVVCEAAVPDVAGPNAAGWGAASAAFDYNGRSTLGRPALGASRAP